MASNVKPKPKVAAATGGGAIVTIIIAIAQSQGYDLDPAIAALIATVVAAALGWLKRESSEVIDR
jgi:small neutral amino acid transporter SnatA (MarC family)